MNEIKREMRQTTEMCKDAGRPLRKQADATVSSEGIFVPVFASRPRHDRFPVSTIFESIRRFFCKPRPPLESSADGQSLGGKPAICVTMLGLLEGRH